MYIRKFVALISLLAVFICLSGPQSFARAASKCKGVKAHCIIDASPECVYKAIRSIRESDNAGFRQLKCSGEEALLLEVFDGLPIIGQAICLYKEKYTRNSRIDFELVESDRFKAFEGAWVLTPQCNGESTRLELSTYISTGLKLPFADRLTKMTTMKGVKERLRYVQKMVEEQSRTTKTGSVPQVGRSL